MAKKKVDDPASLIKLIERLELLEPKELVGAIAMLDALGTRDRDMGGAHEFIEVIQYVINDLSHGALRHVRESKALSSCDSKAFDFDIMSFGDTVIISAGFKLEDEPDRDLLHETIGLVGVV